MANRNQSGNISGGRQAAYYIGGALIVIGMIVFLSTFLVVVGASRGTPGTDTGAAFITRALTGFVLIGVGKAIRAIGARGLAGSGVVLNPEQARRDLKPYSKMAGGMVGDALDEAEVDFGGGPERVVMIKCRDCAQLNEEDSKFCQECGKPL